MATYTVRRGDTGNRIARQEGITFPALKAVNPGVVWTNLQIGQVLQLPGAVTPPPTPGTYLFADEFDGPAGSPPDPAKWVYDIGYGEWGNEELETYTKSTANCFQDGNGNLVIRAIKSGSIYTSARIKTLGKFSNYGGTWEARLKVPIEAGTWPAWWCMGVSPSQWPQSGEVDIVEVFGDNAFMETSVHINDGSGGMQAMAGQKGIRYQDNTVDGNFHVYRMAWTTAGFVFSMDGKTYLTVTPAGKTGWTYNNGNPLYMLLNLAIGGAGGGQPAPGFYVADFVIDYVRIW